MQLRGVWLGHTWVPERSSVDVPASWCLVRDMSLEFVRRGRPDPSVSWAVFGINNLHSLNLRSVGFGTVVHGSETQINKYGTVRVEVGLTSTGFPFPD